MEKMDNGNTKYLNQLKSHSRGEDEKGKLKYYGSNEWNYIIQCIWAKVITNDGIIPEIYSISSVFRLSYHPVCPSQIISNYTDTPFTDSAHYTHHERSWHYGWH